MNFPELQNATDALILRLEQQGLLTAEKILTNEFMEEINQSPYLITVHDVEFYRPVCINDKMRDFYGFKKNRFKGLDYLYYIKTIHPSMHFTLAESILFFRNEEKNYLNLTYKLRHKSKEWRVVNGTSKTILRDHKGKSKYAISLLVEIENDSAIDIPSKQNRKTVDVTIFSKREIDVLRLIVKGLTSAEIADKLYLSVETVKSHRKNILTKSNCANVAQLVARCANEGWV